MSSQKPFSRTVQDLGNGCRGVSIPAELVERHDIEQGDELFLEHDDDSVTFHLSD